MPLQIATNPRISAPTIGPSSTADAPPSPTSNPSPMIAWGPNSRPASNALLAGLRVPKGARAENPYGTPTKAFATWKQTMVDQDIPGFLESLHPNTLAWDAFQNPDTRDAAARAFSRLYGDAALGERLRQNEDTVVYELLTALPFDNTLTFRLEPRGWLIDLNQ